MEGTSTITMKLAPARGACNWWWPQVLGACPASATIVYKYTFIYYCRGAAYAPSTCDDDGSLLTVFTQSHKNSVTKWSEAFSQIEEKINRNYDSFFFF